METLSVPLRSVPVARLDAHFKQHVLSLPSMQSLKFYHAHSASTSSISISPFPPPLPASKVDAVSKIASEHQRSPASSSTGVKPPQHGSPRTPKQVPVAQTPSNAIHIATSSIDGHVCVQSLTESRDVLLRDFGRPVQAVALSPDYKNDRSYLSGGLAGSLILTAGGRAGTSSTSNTTGSAAAQASGWLGSIGLGSNTGKDTVLHSSEGTISTISWSLSGKYVVWVNEKGIKIMRSNLHLESAESDFAWKRMSHVDAPHRPGWEQMAAVWRPHIEWIDEAGLESDNDYDESSSGTTDKAASGVTPARRLPNLRGQKDRIEKMVVGWGGTIWIIDVHPGGSGVGKEVGERKIGRVEVITMCVYPFHSCLNANIYPVYALIVSYLEFRYIPQICFLYLHTLLRRKSLLHQKRHQSAAFTGGGMACSLK